MLYLICSKCNRISKIDYGVSRLENLQDISPTCSTYGCAGNLWFLDEFMVPIIDLLQKKHWPTAHCCSAHVDELLFRPYIRFDLIDEKGDLLDNNIGEMICDHMDRTFDDVVSVNKIDEIIKEYYNTTLGYNWSTCKIEEFEQPHWFDMELVFRSNHDESEDSIDSEFLGRYDLSNAGDKMEAIGVCANVLYKWADKLMDYYELLSEIQGILHITDDNVLITQSPPVADTSLVKSHITDLELNDINQIRTLISNIDDHKYHRSPPDMSTRMNGDSKLFDFTGAALYGIDKSKTGGKTNENKSTHRSECDTLYEENE